jgi:hypothetical protein
MQVADKTVSHTVTNTKCRIDDGHIVARNMQRKEINILRKIVHQIGFIYKVTSSAFSIIITVFFSPMYKNMHQFACTDKKAPDNSQFHRAHQNCGYSVWNLIHVTSLKPLGRPTRRWEDNIKMDLQEVGYGGTEWMALA